jgi:hypothetical protein
MIKLKLPQFNTSKDNVCKVCLYLSLALFITSLMLQITITNKYSIKGGEMVELEAKKETLNRDLSALRLEISETSSMSSIEIQATRLGFSEYTSPIVALGTPQFAAAQ